MRLLVWLIIAFVGYKIFKGFFAHKNEEVKDERLPGEETHKDPICGVYVSSEDAVVGNLEGQRIYFCSMECLNKFQEQLQHKQ